MAPTTESDNFRLLLAIIRLNVPKISTAQWDAIAAEMGTGLKGDSYRKRFASIVKADPTTVADATTVPTTTTAVATAAPKKKRGGPFGSGRSAKKSKVKDESVEPVEPEEEASSEDALGGPELGV